MEPPLTRRRTVAACLVLALPACKRRAPEAGIESAESGAVTTETAALSDFDRIIRPGLGEIPPTFRAIVDKIAAATGSEYDPAFIPMGRSLSRRATDFADPRIVVPFIFAGDKSGPDHTEISRPNGIYLGFAKKAGTVEVISYNQQEGRFEFELIEGLGIPGQKPVVYRPERERCLGCHTVGTPIYSRMSWAETANQNAELLDKTRKAIAAAQKKPDNDALKYEGFTLPKVEDADLNRNTSPSEYVELAAEESAIRLKANWVWDEVCGEKAACRADLLKYTLHKELGVIKEDASVRQSQPFKAAKAAFIAQLTATSGKPELVHFLPSFGSRNPLKDKLVDSLAGDVNKPDLNTAVAKDVEGNDLYATTAAGTYVARSFWKSDFTRLTARLAKEKKAGETLTAAFTRWTSTWSDAVWAKRRGPLDRCVVVAAILGEQPYGCAADAAWRAPAEAALPSTGAVPQDLAEFGAACGRCHGATGNAPRFLAGATAKEVRENATNAAPCLEKVLSWGDGALKMPLEGSAEYQAVAASVPLRDRLRARASQLAVELAIKNADAGTTPADCGSGG